MFMLPFTILTACHGGDKVFTNDNVISGVLDINKDIDFMTTCVLKNMFF